MQYYRYVGMMLASAASEQLAARNVAKVIISGAFAGVAGSCLAVPTPDAWREHKFVVTFIVTTALSGAQFFSMLFLRLGADRGASGDTSCNVPSSPARHLFKIVRQPSYIFALLNTTV